MRAGKRNVQIGIYKLSPRTDKHGQQIMEPVLWRKPWAEYRSIRGSEATNAREFQASDKEIHSMPSIEIIFNWVDVMSIKPDGQRIDASMTMKVEESGLWLDIGYVDQDLGARKRVRVVATEKRLPQ